MTREAMKQALEALESKYLVGTGAWRVQQDQAITALRQAIAEEALRKVAQLGQEIEQEPVIDGDTSDGYHTFNELYEFRKAYNAALFNEWAAGGKCEVHKSWRHHDGELCFGGGWFIVVAVLPQGQISNHYEAKDWDLFSVPETERALFEFDGHKGSDVIARLKSYTRPQPAAWVGLTEDGIHTALNEIRICPVPGATFAWLTEFARAIEAKLKAKNGFPQTEKNT